MPGKLAALGAAFLDCFEAVNASTSALRHVAPLPLAVSTITLTGTLDVSAVPVEQMRLAAQLAEELGEPLEFVLDDCDADNPPPGKRRRRREGAAASGRRFRYQLPLRRNGKSLKLFHNGSVHVTGCGSPAEFLDMAAALEGFLLDAGGVRARLLDFDVQMINASFVVTDPVTGRPLSVAPGALLRTLPPHLRRAEFDAERHPSLKIPLLDGEGRKTATACIFQTGCVTVMGARAPRHLADAYALACGVLERGMMQAAGGGSCQGDASGDALGDAQGDAAGGPACRVDATSRARTTASKTPFSLVDGYPFGLLSCCLS